MRLENKVAIITGAGSGNGRGMALRFAEERAAVAVADVDEAGARETARLIEDRGGAALVTRTDVRERGDVEHMVAATLGRFGGVDILVNNAGVETLVPFLDLPEAEWDRVLAVNLKGAFLCGQVVGREMARAGRGGAIVNIASVNSTIALAGQAHYVSSKGGLLMLTKAMALDLAPHRIRVNAIGPGIIETAMTARSLADPDRRRFLLDKVPLGRVGQPRDVANAAVFLVSEESDYVTGTILYVDGGWLIQ
jgi:glucose 1-dehydrogenase